MLTVARYRAAVNTLVLLFLSACHSNGDSSSSPPDSSGKVVVMPSISGTVTAMSGASRTLNIPFNANESTEFSNLTVTGLAALPAGWSGPASFSCATVGTGNGCMLSLTFAPTSAGSGTLTLQYSYSDSTGAAQSGSLSVPYASTANDNVVGTAAPSGQINAVVSAGTQPVIVTFTTDDGNVASSLNVTSPLNSLPVGWNSVVQSFSCASVSTGNGCQLSLTYAPSAIGTGTLALEFAYVDNAGTQKSGTVSIPYAATVHDTVTGTVAPSGTINGLVNTPQPVSVTFTTDDGQAATGLSITASALSALPAGWSSTASSFSCTSVSVGSGCHLDLTFSPTVAGSGSVSLSYSYTDNAGSAKSGTVSIPFSARIPRAYIADPNSSPYLCSINSDGTLNGCTSMGLGFNIWDLAFNGNTVYMSNVSANNISICSVAADGSFSNCSTGGTNMNGPSQLTIQGSFLYVANAGGSVGVTVCSIDPSSGALSNCSATGSVPASRGVTSFGNFTYAGSAQGGATIDVCATDPATGLLGNCAATPQSAAYSLAAANGYLYTSQGPGVGVCPIGSDGGIPTCATSTIASAITQVWGVTLNGSLAYVTTEYDDPSSLMISFDVYLCSVSPADGSLSNCVVSDGGAYPYFLLHVIIQ